ncbi:MAG: DNA cytosine methyltransferase [Candidatus Omnitrophica bacterium]|nr:DNA cytosine methyltransferase [Candidatus Omnitrophota bacterium]
MQVVSLFAGAGGLDLGFEKAGFLIKWANEYDPTIWETFKYNFPRVELDQRSILDVPSSAIPDTDGIIGGPPCQSWSEAGAGRGINDKRGKVFWEYIRILRDKKPLFFLAENVSGMLHQKHGKAFNSILEQFSDAGYNVKYDLLNVNYYDVPQERWRVIFVGYRKDLGISYQFPSPKAPLNLRDAIWDLKDSAVPAAEFNRTKENFLKVPNHEYMTGSFSTIFMSRNRVRGWDEPSYTIQAGGRHAPIHPQAPKMLFVEQDKRIFVPGKEKLYRRLSIRECARVQTFPDSFIFKYKGLADGYKMVGNAVPVNFALAIAKQIKKDIVCLLKVDSVVDQGELILV